MPFDRDEVSTLLVAVHRRCSICHRFCGVKMETDHITPGNDDISNALPVCFECHAEIHSYNDNHPRGRKFLPAELRAHKQQWLRVCENNPEIFVGATWRADVGPLQALIDELEFNKVVSKHSTVNELGALFADNQFRRAIAQGAIAVLEPSLKESILESYAATGRANQRILAYINQDVLGHKRNLGRAQAEAAITEAAQRLDIAREQLLRFLSNEATQCK